MLRCRGESISRASLPDPALGDAASLWPTFAETSRPYPTELLEGPLESVARIFCLRAPRRADCDPLAGAMSPENSPPEKGKSLSLSSKSKPSTSSGSEAAEACEKLLF